MKTLETITVGMLLMLLAVSPVAKWGWIDSLHAQDVMFCLVLAFGLWTLAAGGRLKHALKQLPLPALGLIGVAFMSIAQAVDVSLALKKSVEYALFMAILAVVLCCCRRQNRVRALAAGMTVICMLILVLAAWQLARAGSFLGGVFSNRNLLTGVLSGLVLVSAAALDSAPFRYGRAAAMLIVAAVFLVLPSPGWLSVGVGVMVFCMLRNTRRLGVCLGVAALCGILISRAALPQHFAEQSASLTRLDPNGEDVSQRYIEWHAALSMLRDNLVLGVGAGNYQPNIGRYFGLLPKLNTLEHDAQNGWLVIASTLGLAGLCMTVWLFWAGIRGAWRHLKTCSDTITAGGVAAACAWAAANMFTPVLLRETGPAVMVTLGLLWQHAARTEPEEGPAADHSSGGASKDGSCGRCG